MTSHDNSVIYEQKQFKDVWRQIREGTETDCERYELRENYHASGLAVRNTSMDSDDRLFLFHLVDTYPEDKNSPAMIQARFKYGSGLTGELESALRTSGEERLPIRVRGYLEEKTFVVEELEFNGRKYVKKEIRQLCLVRRKAREEKK